MMGGIDSWFDNLDEKKVSLDEFRRSSDESLNGSLYRKNSL